MLEVLQGLIQQQGQAAVVNNPAVPNHQNNAVMQEVMSGILGGMGGQAASNGGIGSLLGMLGGGNAGNGSNPIVGAISQQVIGNLMSKFGLSNSAASGVVASMVPAVLGSLMSKANDSNDSSVDAGSIQNVLGGLLGGGNQQQAGGMGALGSILGGIFGK